MITLSLKAEMGGMRTFRTHFFLLQQSAYTDRRDSPPRSSNTSKRGFGPLKFYAHLNAEGLKARWALIYAAPVLGLIVVFMGLAAIGASGSIDRAGGTLT